MTKQVDLVVEELAREGSPAGKGSFRLDTSRARQALREHQLEDPRRYVLLFVQAAVLKGAQWLEVQLRAGGLTLRFDGRPFSRAELLGLYDDVFADPRDDDHHARQILALGVNAALSLGPRWVRVTSGQGAARAELRCSDEEPDRVQVAEEARAGEHSEVEVRWSGLRWTPGRWARTWLRIQPEERLLRQRCRFVPLHLRINGDPVPTGSELPVAQHTVSIDDFGGEVGIAHCRRHELGEAMLLQHGVWVTTLHMTPRLTAPLEADARPDLVALVDVSELRTDATRFELVRDAGFARLEERLLAAASTCLAKNAAEPVGDRAPAPVGLYPAPGGELQSRSGAGKVASFLTAPTILYVLVALTYLLFGMHQPGAKNEIFFWFFLVVGVVTLPGPLIVSLLYRRARGTKDYDDRALVALVTFALGVLFTALMPLILGLMTL